MNRRQWTSKQKFQIVLESLKGAPLGELCARHGISQGQYYKWKDLFFKYGERAFEINKTTRTEDALKKQVRQLKSVIGDLTIELKKNEFDD